MRKRALILPRVSSAAAGAGRRARIAALAALALTAAACASPEQRIERYLKSGDDYLEEGLLGLANVQYQNALKIDEENVAALTGLASIAEKRANYEQMFGILQRINRIDPQNTRTRLDLAKLYLLTDDSASSLDLVNNVLEGEPRNAEAIAVKAAVMFRLQNNTEALALAKQALEIDPNSQEAVAVLASERVQDEDLEGALAILDAALKRDAKAPVLHILRVQVLTSLGRTDDINQAYIDLITEYPEDANYRRLYASSLIARDKLGEARAQLVEVARLLPRQNEAKLDVVRIDYRMDGKAKAEKTLRAYVADNKDDDDLKFALGAFLREQKDYAGAEAVYQDLLARKDAEVDEILRAKNELAALRLIEGKRPEAEKLIAEILAADSVDPDALIKRAGLKLADGEIDPAINDLRIVLGDHPDSTPARLLTGAAFERKGDMDFAESEYAQAVQTSQKGSQASHIFAQFLIRRGQADRAEKVLVESIAAHPNATENLKLLAALRLDKQDWRGAEEAAKALGAVDDSDEVVSRILGAAYSGLKDYAGAIEVLTEEHDKAPLSSRPLATLVQAYINAGRVADAEAFLNDTIAKNPSYYEARVLLAQVERAEGKGSQAIETLRAAITLDPLRPEAYEALYGVNVLEGRRDEAGRVIEQGVAAIPDNDGLQILKADHLIATGKSEAAIPIYETILARRPNDLIVANNLASLLSERGDKQSVARAVDAAAPLKGSSNPYFLDTYGWALYLGGDEAGGIAALEKAAAAAPTLADARYHLGVALIETGETERGRAELQAVIDAPNAAPERIADAKRRLATQ